MLESNKKKDDTIDDVGKIRREGNVFVIEADMKNRPAKDIAKDFALQISAICDQIAEERSKNNQ